jgi:integrase
VSPKTLSDYVKRILLFTRHLQGAADLASITDLDSKVVTWFDLLYLRGHSPEDGSKFLAALQHFWPALRAHGGLVRSWRAVKGWKKLRPVFSRVPLPLTAFYGIVGALLWMEAWEEAIGVILMFACYLRPVDLLGLRSSSLIPPSTTTTGSKSTSWALLLGDRELARPNKSGEYDESVIFDWPLAADMAEWLEELRLRPATKQMWSFDRPHLTSLMVEACRLADVEVLKPQLYSFRHGGASSDALQKTRPLSEIKKRGRWKSDASVRRYEKAALALREEKRMTPQSLRYGCRIERSLGDIFCGRLAPPVPPRAAEQRSA